MSMHDGQYYLSNSEMNDFETMCPQVWKAKYIDMLPALWEDDPEVNVKDWGVEFETLAIGSGVGGRMVSEAKRAKMKKSDYYARIQQQAADCRRYFKALGGKILSRQEYIYTSIIDAEGQEIFICGGLDVKYGFPGTDLLNIIIDLKLTGDTDNDFGKFQFGNPEKVNPQQSIQYKLLHKAKFGVEAEFEWWIFDKSPSMNQKFIRSIISEVTEAIHIDKVSRVYNEIMMALELDDWGVKNTFENCRNCPCKCQWEKVLPDLVEVTF